jgi:HEAT repeat protein
MRAKLFLKTAVFLFLISGGGLFFGCARKGKAATENPDERIQALEEQIRSLQGQLASVQQELAAERQTSLELAEIVRGYREKERAGQSLKDNRTARTVHALPERLSERQKANSEEVFSITASVSASQAIQEASARFAGETASSERLAALEGVFALAQEQEPELLSLLSKALEDPEPQVVRTAAQMLEFYRNPAVIPLLEKALRCRDEEVRLSGLIPLEEIEDPRCAELAAAALGDPSDAVRSRALDVIRGQPPDIQILSLKRGMELAAEEVKSEVLSVLELRGDKAAVEVMFLGLKDPNPQIRREVSETLRILLDQDFQDYNQAMKWWKTHHSRYDEDLLEQ